MDLRQRGDDMVPLSFSVHELGWEEDQQFAHSFSGVSKVVCKSSMWTSSSVLNHIENIENRHSWLLNQDCWIQRRLWVTLRKSSSKYRNSSSVIFSGRGIFCHAFSIYDIYRHLLCSPPIPGCRNVPDHPGPWPWTGRKVWLFSGSQSCQSGRNSPP